jgi:DNA mismatch repair protein MutL
MDDIIQLLPESIANQIAAGEVIQRPASVIKELLENALDAGSTEIEIALKDSGKTMILISDNGKGMSETDARMSFERHATSKIRKASDLFSIKTMGFRGEALASIASIAHVDLKTRTENSDTGTHIVIKGSTLEKQALCQTPKGTSISVKNLFYNVPARRKFLKTDSVELRHILEEFKRIALIHPEVFFKVYHNDSELYYLPASNFRQRVVGILGKKYNEMVLPVEEETDSLHIQGYIGKASAARKSKGDQYLYVNERFIKSNYLNHAIKMAYGDLLTKEMYPFYILNLTVEPEKIDINVHPTKHEIKFQEERLVYNFLNVAIKHSLGKYSLNPMIDFDNMPDIGKQQVESFGGFSSKEILKGDRASKKEISEWNKMYNDISEVAPSGGNQIILQSSASDVIDGGLFEQKAKSNPIQIHNTYIVHSIKSGFVLIDQKSAHERILYEDYLAHLEEGKQVTQKVLFPITISYKPEKYQLIINLLDALKQLGFETEDFGTQSIIIHGIPSGMSDTSIEEVLERFLDNYMENLSFDLGVNENFARSMAKSASIPRGKRLDTAEMQTIIDSLFSCEMPYISPEGRKSIITYELNELSRLFES